MWRGSSAYFCLKNDFHNKILNNLERKIISRIQREGPVTFDIFMEYALYDPEYGYYCSRHPRIGRKGDFYTSSHLHPAFGMMVGRQVGEMWKVMGKTDNFSIVEIGAGEGYLSKDMLDSLRGSEFYDTLHYEIIERNPFAVERQKVRLSDHLDKLEWKDSISQLTVIKGCIISNEVIDAFPVHLVRMDRELKEVYVGVENNRLIELIDDTSTAELNQFIDEFSINLEAGYRTEINLRVKEWLDEVDAILTEGFIITIDYGYSASDYYSEDRNRGTLMCYYRHQLRENPLENIGQQDISAHVNFSSLMKWADVRGLKTVGYCSQGAFLVSLGIDEEIRKLSLNSKNYFDDLSRIKKLILPQGMGDSHNVMVNYKGRAMPSLKGFLLKDRKKSLLP